ncbi:MAG: hypothetical protein KC776_12370 [Myxococcales bacterium]|nr:hypothetical protein [Myxococcales bacterium]MCB9576587.1 hypothetical protein [Polyangiaceae bacterium]MCB9609747.1 hypothetical protein [Polyangiaceae bacterium]
MRALAKKRGGECLSQRYRSVDDKLRWRCAEGHEWKTIPYLVLNGSWCPECSLGRRPPAKMLAYMRRVARERGGRCLATAYAKAKDDYVWECAQGHRWSRSWDQIQGGSWCPKCVGRLPAGEALAELRRIARQHGGKCLSPRYLGSNVKLEWQCAEGHRWLAPPGGIRGGRWCARCAGNVPLTLTELRKVAVARGGKCLAKTVHGAHTPVRWRCAQGHEWLAGPSRVKHGNWCPECARAPRYTLADMQAVAAAQGGQCVSKRFVTMNHHLRWQCAKGHTWTATGVQVATTGTWCPVCWGRQLGTIAQMRELARSRGGKCLSRKYVNAAAKLRWRCAAGHEFEMAPASAKRSHWCPYCLRRGSRGIGDFLLAEHQRVARERGGTCLSKRYVDALTPLRWRCQLGHEWEASPGAIVNGTWCPECAHTRRPKLEEVQRAAREQGGRCLSKRYINSTTPLSFECRYGHRWRTRPLNVRRGCWCPKCARRRGGAREPLTIEELQLQAEERGGACLSKEYLGHKTPLTWRCGLGHEWEARPLSIRNGSWCPVCSGRQPLTLEDMQRSAENRGGRCLSKGYKGVRDKLTWECAQGHRWRAQPFVIRSGSWCPKCMETPPDVGIARVSALAREHGGVCLSSKHRDPSKPLRWRCASGHVWRAPESTVVGGQWCPRCVT